MNLKQVLLGVFAVSLGWGILASARAAEVVELNSNANKKVELQKTTPIFTNPEYSKLKVAPTGLGTAQALEYSTGNLMIPVRGRSATVNVPGMSCRNFNPIYSNFTYLEERSEERRSLVYSIPGIQCQIDETKVVKRLSNDDGYDSAFECYSNRSYCDAMWEDQNTRQIWFLKFPESY